MKHYGKRLLALLLVFALSAGMVGTARAATAETEAAYDDFELSGSFGGMLAAELGDDAETGSQESDYNVTELTVDGSTATVTYQVSEGASLIVAIYDETTGQMLATGMADVDNTTETAMVPITGSLPEYFVAKAFLLDRDTFAPLGKEYQTEMYTVGMQTLLRQTVDDFDPDLVLNLDNDRTTNFGVYNEDTIQVENSRAVVTDNGNGTYTVTNADAAFTSLEPGNKLSYTDAEGTLWLLKVARISVRGKTVTITEDTNARLDDFFDTLKIEATEQDAEVTVEGYVDPNASNGATEAIYARSGVSTNARVSMLAADLETDEKTEEKFTLEFSTDKEQAIVVFGSVELTISIKYYYSADLDVETTEIKLTPKVSFDVKTNEKGGAATTDYMIYRDLSLADWMQLKFFGGVLTVGLEPKLELKVEGKVEATISFSGTIGVKRTGNGEPESLSTAPVAKFECKDEATIYAGVSLSPYVDIVDKKIMRISLKGALGVETKATMSKEFNTTEKTSIHDCDLCLDGKVTSKGEVTVELNLLDGIGTASYSLLKVEKEYVRFYYSFDHREFGSGKCPHIRYLVELLVQTERGEPLPGAQIEGLDDAVLTTNLSGKAQEFAYKGEYTLTAASSGEKHTGTKTITVKDAPVSVTITARSSAKGITVTVTDQERNPLSGMTISGTGLNTAPVTDKDGVAEFELDDGNYTLTASNGVYSGAGTLSVRGSAKRLTIIASKDLQDVTVTVIKADGTRVPDLTINGTGLNPAPVTDGNGQAKLRLPWGGYELSVSDGSYSGSISVIVGSEPVDTGIIVQSFDYPVTVTVVDENGKNLPNMTIGGTGLDSAPVTGMDGVARFQLARGSYSLTASNSEYKGTGSLVIDNKPVSTTIVAKKQASYDVMVTVVDKDDTGLPGLSIGGTGLNPAPITGVDGTATFRLPDGTYQLTVTDSKLTASRMLTVTDTSTELKIGLADVSGEFGDELHWHYDGTDGKLTIWGSGAMPDWEHPSTTPTSSNTLATRPWHKLREAIVAIEISEGITRIGSCAFSGCSSLSSINLSDGLRSIGQRAFEKCYGLNSIVIPDGVGAINIWTFQYCHSLSSIDLPDSVTNISDGAFEGCSSLSSIDLPDGLIHIRQRAFSGCSSLSSVVIPAGVKDIGMYAFSCSNLTTIRFSGDIPIIANNTFTDGLRKVIATVYYPANNTTWTADKLQNYGGNLTWIPY